MHTIHCYQVQNNKNSLSIILIHCRLQGPSARKGRTRLRQTEMLSNGTPQQGFLWDHKTHVWTLHQWLGRLFDNTQQQPDTVRHHRTGESLSVSETGLSTFWDVHLPLVRSSIPYPGSSKQSTKEVSTSTLDKITAPKKPLNRREFYISEVQGGNTLQTPPFSNKQASHW